MKLKLFIQAGLFLCFTQISISCKTSPTMTFSVPKLDTTILVTKIPIADLLKNYKSFQGQYIETTGYFHQTLEHFAIYSDKLPSTDKLNAFWLDTDGELTIDRASFEKMNGKQITIRGRSMYRLWFVF